MAPTCSKCVSKKSFHASVHAIEQGNDSVTLICSYQARDSEMRDTWRPEGAETAGRKVFEGQVIYSIAAA